MAHAETCPICYGSGKFLPRDRYQYFVDNPKAIKMPEPVVCHGCSGRGWVEIKDEPEHLIQLDVLGKAHKVS